MQTLIRGVFAALALSAFACSAQDAAPKYEMGKQYDKVRASDPPPDAKRILVQEFFWYGCQHCYALDPLITQWAKSKPADVDFVRVPNSLGRPQGLVHSKTFYTEEQLNLMDKTHKPFFDAIHRDGARLDTQPQVQEWFTRTNGVLPDVFNSAFTSFMVDSKVRRAEEMSAKFGIASVPTVVVGGTYFSNSTKAGDFPKLIQVIDFMVDKVRKERGGK